MSSRENTSWAESVPAAAGLYEPENERDGCGVALVVDIKGRASRRIVDDARQILCNLTHRGAVGSDARDGDGAGVMTGIPDGLFRAELARELGVELPAVGQYATGNVFFKPEPVTRVECMHTFEDIARSLSLRVLTWRTVPCDNSGLGPAARSREPLIMQPFIVLDRAEFDEAFFARQLYVLQKTATRSITAKRWFYICSLSERIIVYKGLFTPAQVYGYFGDLIRDEYVSHFALVHSRFSTNTFPSWDRAQPMRYCAHNGEINTIRGNKNWMHAREGVLQSERFGDALEQLYPIIDAGSSDSGCFDNILELLVVNGTASLPEAMMMMIPEAWQNDDSIDRQKRDFYRWASAVMEPMGWTSFFRIFRRSVLWRVTRQKRITSCSVLRDKQWLAHLCL